LLRPFGGQGGVKDLGDGFGMLGELVDRALAALPELAAEAHAPAIRRQHFLGRGSEHHARRREARISVLSSSVRLLMVGLERYFSSARDSSTSTPVASD